MTVRIKTSDDQASEDTTHFLYQICYSSILKQDLDAEAMNALVSQAQRNNEAKGITGMLMVDRGLVIQWLEGEKSAVRELWSKLQEDARHHCIVELLHKNFAKERVFPNWSMYPATRREMLEIIHDARIKASEGEPTPWAGAIATLCILIDPAYAQSYAASMRNHATHVQAGAAHD